MSTQPRFVHLRTHRFFNDRWYCESETIGQSVCCKQYGCVGINGFLPISVV